MQTDQPKDGYDLLPCAHCGAKANLQEQNDPEGYRHSVECGACHVVTDRYLTTFAAVKGWNTRAAVNAFHEMKEALEKIAGCDEPLLESTAYLMKRWAVAALAATEGK